MNLSIFSRETLFFQKFIFFKSCEKPPPKHPQDLPQTFQNPFKSHRETIENATSKHRAKKMQTNCEKIRSWSQLGPQNEKCDSTRRYSAVLGGPCEPHSVGPSAPNFQEGGIQPRWGRDPRALFTLRASHQGGDHESFRESLSKFILQTF